MMEAVLVVSRFAQFSAAMLLLGTSLFAIQFQQGRVVIPEIRQTFRHWQRPVLLSAAATALVSSVLWLDIEAGLMGGSWSDAANLQTLLAVLLQTRFGHVWLWILASIAAVMFVLLTPARHAHISRRMVLIAGLSVFLVAGSSFTGHAVMHRGLAGAIHLIVQVIHVLAASVWLGSLPALGFALGKARTEGQTRWRDAALYILPRYSRMGYLAVGLILVTGCVNSWFMVNGIDALFTTTYGRILIAKISLFALMVGLAAMNRLVLTPGVLDQKRGKGATERALHQLRRSVAVEQLLGLTVIAVVSVLGTVAPVMSSKMEM
jgi:copper resistance protein D